MSKKKPQKDKKKLKKGKYAVKPGQKRRTLDGGATKCRFCGKWVPLSNAWNCCYADKYETAIDFRNNKAKVTSKEDVEIIDVQTPEVEDNGES